MDDKVQALIEFGLDEGEAQKAVKLLDQIDAGMQNAEKSAKNFLLQSRQISRDLSEIGRTSALAGGALLGGLTLAANEYVTRFKGVEKTADDFTAATQRETDATTKLGRVAATALIPIMNQVADFQSKVADFMSAHPEIVQAAVQGGTALVAGGGALIAAGTAINTISHTFELLRDFSKDIDIAKIGVTLGAVAAGALVAQKGLNLVGEAANNEYLKNYQLSQSLDTFGKIIGSVVGLLPDALKTLVTVIATVAEGFDSLDSALKKTAVQFGGFLDQIATAVRNLVNSLPGGNNPLASSQDLAKTSQSIAKSFNLNDPEQAAEASRLSLLLTQKDVTQETLEYVQREIERQQELNKIQSDQSGTAQGIADWLAKAKKSLDDLKPGLGQILSNIFGGLGLTANLGNAGNVFGGSGSSGTGAAGPSPEIAKATVAYLDQVRATQQQRAQQDKQQLEEHNYQELQTKKAQNYQLDLLQKQGDLEISNEQYRQQQESAKAQRDFDYTEAETKKRLNFEALQKEKEHQFNLSKFVSDRDVAGFVEAQKQHSFDLEMTKEQNDFDAQSRKDNFDEQQKETAIANQQTLDNMKIENKRRYDEQVAANQHEDELQQQAWDHQQEVQKEQRQNEDDLAEQHFAEEIAGLSDHTSKLGQIWASYYEKSEQMANDWLTTHASDLSSMLQKALGIAGSTAAPQLPTSASASSTPFPSSQSSGEYYYQYQNQAQTPNVTVQNVNLGQIATPADVAAATQQMSNTIRSAFKISRSML